MAINMFNHINRTLLKFPNNHIRALTTALEPNHRYCIISCKRKEYNHYSDTVYDKFSEIVRASKGWNHNKSKGDFFTIHAKPDEYVEPQIKFELLDINSDLIQVLLKQKIYRATEFQAKAIPLVCGEGHLMLAAETGCGKTISYLLPIIQKLIGRKSSEFNTPKAIVLVPNRELAYQIGEVAQILSEAVGVRVKIVVGGTTKKLMMNPDFAEIDLLVATPGALGKLSSVGVYRLNEVLYTVLDEADTLLDDSFIERMSGIIRRVPQSKIILVSATMPRKLPELLEPIESTLQQLVSPKLHKPLFNITQKFLRTTRSAKPSTLLQIAKANKNPLLIFTNRNTTCNWLALFLRENGVACSNINGDMNYAIRIEQWNNFIRGETQILSATDVGSRGLDTTKVQHVLNYDFPLYAADYLHRIGRIGRLGSHEGCKATNLVSGPEEVRLVQEIELAVRTNQALMNVDGNITNIVQKKIKRAMRQNA